MSVEYISAISFKMICFKLRPTLLWKSIFVNTFIFRLKSMSFWNIRNWQKIYKSTTIIMSIAITKTKDCNVIW